MKKPTRWRLDNFEWLKANILENYLTVHMNHWGAKWESSPCGTVACIAGTCDWLLNVSGEEPKDARKGFLFNKTGTILNFDQYDDENAEKVARANAMKFLGIRKHEADKLFLPAYWPYIFLNKLHGVSHRSKAYAQVIVDRIDHFLETGE